MADREVNRPFKKIAPEKLRLYVKDKDIDIDAEFLKDCVKIFAELSGQKVTYTRD